MIILAVLFWFKHYSSLRSVFLGVCTQTLDMSLEFFEILSRKKIVSLPRLFRFPPTECLVDLLLIPLFCNHKPIYCKESQRARMFFILSSITQKEVTV